jgi:DNA-binding helix-hairpin-helix protein with protein kinase domain
MPPNQNRAQGGAACLLALGIIGLVIANIYIVRPALRGASLWACLWANATSAILHNKFS